MEEKILEAVERAIQGLLFIDRRVWKRYFNIETPLYKLWWEKHSAYMQQQLEDQRLTF